MIVVRLHGQVSESADLQGHLAALMQPLQINTFHKPEHWGVVIAGR
jgi:hypothetical protein